MPEAGMAGGLPRQIRDRLPANVPGGGRRLTRFDQSNESFFPSLSGDRACACSARFEKGAVPFRRRSRKPLARPRRRDRKSAVKVKSVSVRVDLGGRGIIKNKN